MRRLRQIEGNDPSSHLVAGPPRAAATITGTDGVDHLKGGGADDVIYGLAGNDGLTGAGGDDYLDGGEGDDRLTDNRGTNTLLGGAGDDKVLTNAAGTADGGDGFDVLTVNYFSGRPIDFVLNDDGTVTSTFGTFANFEQFDVSFDHGGSRVVLGDGDDVVGVGGTDNHVSTGAGNDVIGVSGNTGLDVNGGAGFDRLALRATSGFSLDTFDDAAFFADASNRIVGIEAYDVYGGFSGNSTRYTLSTGADFTVHAMGVSSFASPDSITIDASAFTHGIQVSDSGVVYGNDVRTITFEQTTILAERDTGLSVIGSDFNDRIAGRYADGGDGIDTLVTNGTGSGELILRDGGLRGISNYQNFEALDATLGAGSTLRGGGYDDTLAISGTGTEASTLLGGGGDDHLTGGLGDDTLTGGSGRDVLSGGGGADSFVVLRYADLKGGGDVVADFSHADGDRIDLSAIDPSKRDGDQAFTFIGDGAFSGDRQVTELRATSIADGAFLVEGDRNHDGAADFSFTVVANQPLVASDFVL